MDSLIIFAAGLWLLFGSQAKGLLAKIPRLLSKFSIEEQPEANRFGVFS